MAITLTEQERLQSWATWHEDQDINKKQAAKLAADALATRARLVAECLRIHLGRVPNEGEVKRYLNERAEDGTILVWVCWRDEAIALRTEPTTHVKDRRIYLTWHWKNLTTGQVLVKLSDADYDTGWATP